MKKLLIVEDEKILNDFITDLAKSIPGLKVVGNTGDGEKALALVDELKPDMMIMDIMLENLNGTEIVSRIHKNPSRPALLVLSGSLSTSVVSKLMQMGVEGIVEKGESIKELDKAIRTVAAGQLYFSPAVTVQMRKIMISGTDDAPDSLTDRERQIIKLVAESNTSKIIAGKLGISVKTVETHRANIIQKLGVNDAAGLTRYAIANGLICL